MFNISSKLHLQILQLTGRTKLTTDCLLVMITKENNPISLEDYFSYYNLPPEDIEAIKKFLNGEYEAIKGHPHIAHYIFNVLDPHIMGLMSKKRIERDKRRFDIEEYNSQLLEEASEELLEHSFDIIARRIDFRIVEKAMVIAGILDNKFKFIPAYGNQEIISGVVILLYKLGYFKGKDRLGKNVYQSTIMRSFQEWYKTPLLQPCWRNKSKCIDLARQKLIIISEIERNKKNQNNFKH